MVNSSIGTELNSKTQNFINKTPNTVGEFFLEKSNINSVYFISNFGVITVEVSTKNININENVVFGIIAEKYRPVFPIHLIGYIYSPKEFIQISINTDGVVKVFGNHETKGVVRFSLTYVLKQV